MTDYFTLAADLARLSPLAAERRGLLMAKPWRDIKHKSLTSQTFTLTDDECDVVIEALRVAKSAIQTEITSNNVIRSESYTEYLKRWAEKFDDMRERIEAR